MNLVEGVNGTVEIAPDLDVVNRVLEGDTASFELIMRRNNRRLYRIARGILRNDADSEDAVQDAYIRAFENLGQFRGKGTLSSWLAKITVNEALGRLRRTAGGGINISLDDPEEREGANFMADEITGLPDPEQSAARGEFRKLLESSIDALPEAFRLVFILCGVEEMTIAETAECLGVEPATVKTRYHRARKLLQQHLSSMVDSTVAEVFPFDGLRCDRIVSGVFRRLETKRTGLIS